MHALILPRLFRHFLYFGISLPFCIFPSILMHLCAHWYMCSYKRAQMLFQKQTLFSSICYNVIALFASAIITVLAASTVSTVGMYVKSERHRGKSRFAVLAIVILGLWCFSLSSAAFADEHNDNNGNISNTIAPASASTVISVTNTVSDANTVTTANSVTSKNASTISTADPTMDGYAAIGAEGAQEPNAKDSQLNGESNVSLRSGQRLGIGGVNTNKHQGELSNGGLNSPEGIIKWLLSTVVVLGLIFAFAYMLKRSRFVQRGNSGIVLENQLAVGPRERVVQLRVGQRQLLLGVTPNNISFLCDLSAVGVTTKRTLIDESDYDSVSTVVGGQTANKDSSEVSVSTTKTVSDAANVVNSNEMSAIETNAMIQGFSARADDEDDFVRAGLAPLYAEDEQAYTNLPNGSGTGTFANHSASHCLGLGEHGAHGNLAKQESQCQDGNVNAAVTARAANVARNSQAFRTSRGRKLAGAAMMASRGIGAVNALPDDTVLKARAARAKQSQQLEVLARSQEQQQAGGEIGGASSIVRSSVAASHSFADVLAQSYQQHSIGPDSTKGNQ